jgi:hypothetical protein
MTTRITVGESKCAQTKYLSSISCCLGAVWRVRRPQKRCITPEHILASGSLPPGFPWTTIDGKHYWDGGLVSNSPLDQVVEIGGLTGKKVHIVNLWLEKRALPHSIPEVLARRDEIVFAEKIRRNIRIWEYIDDYRQLVEEIMTSLEPKTAEQIRRRPRYIETVGETSPVSITRINREAVEGEVQGVSESVSVPCRRQRRRSL